MLVTYYCLSCPVTQKRTRIPNGESWEICMNTKMCETLHMLHTHYIPPYTSTHIHWYAFIRWRDTNTHCIWDVSTLFQSTEPWRKEAFPLRMYFRVHASLHTYFNIESSYVETDVLFVPVWVQSALQMCTATWFAF